MCLAKKLRCNVEAAAIRHVRVHQVRDYRDVRFSNRKPSLKQSGDNARPASTEEFDRHGSPMRMDGSTTMAVAASWMPRARAPGCDRANIPTRITSTIVPTQSRPFSLHHVSDVFHGGAPNSVIVVFDQEISSTRRVRHGQSWANPGAIARVRTDTGGVTLRKSCHA